MKIKKFQIIFLIIMLCVLFYGLHVFDYKSPNLMEEFHNDSTINHYVRATVDFNLSVNHPLIKVQNLRYKGKELFTLHNFTPYLYEHNKRFADSKWAFIGFKTKKNKKIWLKKIGLSISRYIGISVQFIAKDFTKPFSCEITETSSCGIRVIMFLNNGQDKLLPLIAIKGYVHFTKLGVMKLDQKIEVDFDVTDNQYFRISGKMIGSVYKVASFLLVYDESFGFVEETLLGDPAEFYDYNRRDPNYDVPVGEEGWKDICANKKRENKELSVWDFEDLKDNGTRVAIFNGLDKKSKMAFLRKFIPGSWFSWYSTYSDDDVEAFYFSKLGKIISYQFHAEKEKEPRISVAGTWEITNEYFLIKTLDGNSIFPWKKIKFSDVYLSSSHPATDWELDFHGLIREVSILEEELNPIYHYGQIEIRDVCKNNEFKGIINWDYPIRKRNSIFSSISIEKFHEFCKTHGFEECSVSSFYLEK